MKVRRTKHCNDAKMESYENIFYVNFAMHGKRIYFKYVFPLFFYKSGAINKFLAYILVFYRSPFEKLHTTFTYISVYNTDAKNIFFNICFI